MRKRRGKGSWVDGDGDVDSKWAEMIDGRRAGRRPRGRHELGTVEDGDGSFVMFL